MAGKSVRMSSAGKRSRRCRVLAAGLAVILAGCVQVVTYEPWDPQGRYVCEDGKAFTVTRVQDGSSVAVAYGDQQVTLPQTVGSTDAKYTDGRTTLYLDGERALLDVGGQILARGCVRR